jgi:hypothetical protein
MGKQKGEQTPDGLHASIGELLGSPCMLGSQHFRRGSGE